MRLLLSGLCICFTFILATAQVTNDDCSNGIGLGMAPFCDDAPRTNVGATASNVDDIPDCFVGGSVEGDVWYSFSTGSLISNLVLTLEGINNGPNGGSIQNPQIAIYRGTCDGLALLVCETAESGQNSLKFNLPELTTNTTYLLQVNNFVADGTGTPGDFTICVEEADPIVFIGESASSDACSGTLYDSGGPGLNYRANEDFSFVICPSTPTECLQIDINSFNIDPFDQLRFYAGDNIGAPLLASVSGNDIGTGYRILSSTECVTVRFTSDSRVAFEGFELTWSCLGDPCESSTIENPTVVSNLPFSASNLSTCDGGATFVNSPCSDADFLNGPEYVFEYNAPGNTCTSISISGAEEGTGLIVLNGPPDAATTSCVAAIQSTTLSNVDMRAGGTYYIIVANALGCTNFDINIEEVECMLSPALRSALCNPINDCLADQDQTFNIQLEDGFRDLTITTDVNGGCWLNDGEEPDYFWFTVQAATDGDFGFIMQSAGTPSDIDFNAWGPFSTEQVCENANEIVNFIQNNQPIRSSWNSVDLPTGMARVHPFEGNAIDDFYDCGSTPSGLGDQFVLPIEMQKDQVYVVLINDWGNNVGPEGITVDWSPTDPGLLAPIPTSVFPEDPAVCAGESIELMLENYSNEVLWIGNTATLSCTDCPNPVASPTENTTYTAIVEKACNLDTVVIDVNIFAVDAGPNRRVCLGEDFQIVAGNDFTNGEYSWSITNTNAENLIGFSCTDCPDPIITAQQTLLPNAPTTITIQVTLTTDNCVLQDVMNLTIEPQIAANFMVIEDTEICLGSSINLGDQFNSNGQTYSWTSRPTGFISQSGNPEVNPIETTTYFVSVDNGLCPSNSMDSVTITVFNEPNISLLFTDSTICEGDVVQLANIELEEGVDYSWTGGNGIANPVNPNTTIRPTSSAQYTLTASRGNCMVSETVSITTTAVQANILQGDLFRICKGMEDTLTVDFRPETAMPTWTSNDNSIDGLMSDTILILPNRPTTYYVTVENSGCTALDSVEVVIDSLPVDLSIMPQDTTICEGGIIVFESPVFEPFEFPNIEHKWFPADRGSFQSPDSLYNLVVTADTTLLYYRITENGACRDSSSTMIFVDTIPDIQVLPADTTVCIGESVDVLVIVDAALEDISWMPMTGISCEDCLNPTVFPSMPGENTWTMSAMAGECPVSATVTVNVSAPFALPAQGRICEGQSIQLNDVVDPNLNYTWTSSDPNFGVVTDPTPVVSPIENTSYFLTVVDPVCGELQAQIDIEVLSEPQIQLTNVRTICSGESVQLNSVETPGATYSWSSTDPSFPASSDPFLTVSPSATSTYQLVATNGVCPAARGEITLLVIPSPELPEGQEKFVCAGDGTSLNDFPIDPNFGYSWTADNDPNFSSTDGNPVVTPTETTTYSVTVTNSSCGSKTGSITVTVIPVGGQLSISASETAITLGDELTLDSDVTGIDTQFGSYIWSSSPATGDVLPGDPRITFTPSTPDTIAYRLTYLQGHPSLPAACESLFDEVTVIVTRPPDFRVPNAFTPNNDGDNDFFNVVTTGTAPEEFVTEFKVYNRWGQLVYDNETPSTGWDGRHNGTPAPSDVYVYYIVAKIGDTGDEKVEKGDVTLIR